MSPRVAISRSARQSRADAIVSRPPRGRLLLMACMAALVLASCECDHSAPVPQSELDDVERLQNALTEDPAQLVLDEVDDAVARQRPVIAADLLDEAAIPAVRRHIAAIQALELGTSQGQTFRTRAVRLLRARATSLEHWRDALARGIGHDDEELLDALHEAGEAEHAIAEFLTELAAIRPLETGQAPIDHSGVLEDLPPLAPPATTEGDDTVTPPSEPDPHGADPIDAREDLTEPPTPAPPALRAPHEPELPEDREDHHAIEPPR